MLYNIVQILFLMDKINQAVRDHIVAIIGDMESQLKKMDEGDFKDKAESYQSEEFVNKHLNLAGTRSMIEELRRRGCIID